jgi:hypothetical protein
MKRLPRGSTYQISPIIAGALGSDGQDALRTRYGAWMDDSSRSRLRRIAYGANIDSIERVKAAFVDKVPRTSVEAGDDFWLSLGPDFEIAVADDDLTQILAVATDCDELELINQVGLKLEVGNASTGKRTSPTTHCFRSSDLKTWRPRSRRPNSGAIQTYVYSSRSPSIVHL